MLSLRCSTETDWVPRVQRHLEPLLVDHAHCEMKAARTSLKLVHALQEHPDLVVELSALAREELGHFESVLELLADRGFAFRSLAPSPYASRLRAACRRKGTEGLVDLLICCALIEARSCERIGMLAEQLDDEILRGFYAGLLTSEARHHALFLSMARRVGGREEARARLEVLAEHEASVVGEMPREARFHSRGP